MFIYFKLFVIIVELFDFKFIFNNLKEEDNFYVLMFFSKIYI